MNLTRTPQRNSTDVLIASDLEGGRKGYSKMFLMGVCDPNLDTLTLFQKKNLGSYYHRHQI